MLKSFFVFIAFLVAYPHAIAQPEDRDIFNRFIRFAQEKQLATLPHAQRVSLIGQFFLGTPYQGGTLDQNEEETLVINLRVLDCVTFVDNVLALTLIEKYDESAWNRFQANLVRVRYRHGKIQDYTSRLHYSTDWLHEMCRIGILRDITPDLQGSPFPNKVNLITATAHKRAVFKRDASLVNKMRIIEDSINNRKRTYIPREEITEETCAHIQDGDILLFTTHVKGLDTAHVGIAIKRDNTIHVLHASSGGKRVMISTETLPEYLGKITSHSGIIIARVN